MATLINTHLVYFTKLSRNSTNFTILGGIHFNFVEVPYTFDLRKDAKRDSEINAWLTSDAYGTPNRLSDIRK